MHALLAITFDQCIAFFTKGGIFMVPLVVCSLVAGAVIVMRGLALRRDLVLPPTFVRAIEALLPEDQDGITRLARVARNENSPLARVTDTALSNLHLPKVETIEAVQLRARQEIGRIEGGIYILEIIVGIAPLLGLLGAVAGLVAVFGAFGANADQTDPHLIANGIAESLSTTIVGIAIAIPALIFHLLYTKKVERLATEMERLIAELLSKTHRPPRAARFQAAPQSLPESAP